MVLYALKDMLFGTERASLLAGTFHGLFHITLLSFSRNWLAKVKDLLGTPCQDFPRRRKNKIPTPTIIMRVEKI